VAPHELLGRVRELEEVDLFLHSLPGGLRSLALTGPAGIGKTSVWLEARARAAARGFRVMSAQPAQIEQSLSFAGLADLFAGLPEEMFQSLVPVQRHALEVAVLRAEPDPTVFAARAVPAACLAGLLFLAEACPLVLAVDDAQWLDSETAESLSFALRRLERLPIGVLVSARVDPDRPATFDTSISIDRRQDVALGALSVAVLEDIIRRQTRQSLTRPTLVRIANFCGGNPFYALEIAHELQRVGVPSIGEPLPVPSELQGLVRSRMSRLPEGTRDALLAAACASDPTTALVDVEAIGPAEEAGIVKVSEDARVYFTHPLLAAAVIASASTARRRSVHLALAERVADPEEKARHLGAAALGPDEAVAAALEDAAARAAARGAGATAIDLGRQAIDLTPHREGDGFFQRVVAFGHYARLTSVEVTDCKDRVQSALAVCPSGELRAGLLLAKQVVTWNEGDSEAGYQLVLQAIEETNDPMLAARAHYAAVWTDFDNPVRGLMHLDALLELIDEDDDPLLYAGALMDHAYLRLISGFGADEDALRRGRDMEARIANAGWWERSPVPIIWPLLHDQLDEAVEGHTRRLEWAREVADAGVELSMLRFLSRIELLRGDFAAARRWSDEFAVAAQQTGSNVWMSDVLCSQATLDAHAGELDVATAKGQEALRLSRTSRRAAEVGPRQVLGFVAFCRGDHPLVVEHLGTARAILDEVGQREPAQWRFHPDLVEAFLAVGDPKAAEEVAASLEDRAATFPRPWILAVAARCRGQLRAAAGDLDGAAEEMRRALLIHAQLEMPYEHARTLLAYGQVMRRRGARREARTALGEAVMSFEQAGSTVWAGRAREELKRIPVRRRPSGLTATELEIAHLAAAGLTNKEISKRAFLSTKTVEGNLTRVYSKLGVRSRAELVRAMAARKEP
jgi:DNA-binding CsgD family transcriptional regulator